MLGFNFQSFHEDILTNIANNDDNIVLDEKVNRACNKSFDCNGECEDMFMFDLSKNPLQSFGRLYFYQQFNDITYCLFVPVDIDDDSF